MFLWNRLLWIAVAMAILAFAYWKFEFTTGTRKAKKQSKKAARTAAALEGPAPERIASALPKVAQTFSTTASWRQFFAATMRETVAVFKSIPSDHLSSASPTVGRSRDHRQHLREEL